jgi:hypothetical protein
MLTLLVFATLQAAAATPAPAPVETASPPDIELNIRAHADQIRWRQVGEVRIRAWAEPGGQVIEENIATGLPRPIPGQRTFPDVNWNLRATARIVDQPTAEAGSAEPGPAPGQPSVP